VKAAATVLVGESCVILLLLSRHSRQRERLHATGVFICSSVCLLPNCKNTIFSKT